MFDYEVLYPAVLVAMFPDPKIRRQAEVILNGYGADGSAREPRRVRLAVLKLAGRDLEALQKNVSYAITDYRDVLAWAEYPEAIRSNSWRLPDGSPEKLRLNEADRRQYEKWLDIVLHEEEIDDGP